jgi:hypothetical protein
LLGDGLKKLEAVSKLANATGHGRAPADSISRSALAPDFETAIQQN